MKSLEEFIRDNTEGSSTVIDMGAGYFQKFLFVHPNVRRRIGIELFEDYISKKQYDDVIAIHGDFRNYSELVNKKDFDCAMFIDTIEHIKKVEAIDLLREMQEKFNKIIIFTPRGEHIQDTDLWGTNNELQYHKSFWFESEFEELGFNVEVEPEYHKGGKPHLKDHGAIFAVWTKYKNN